jgi:endonuclease YncB( thermonuclease family)
VFYLKRGVIVLFLLFIAFQTSFVSYCSAMEIDDVAVVYDVIDGDTFDAFPLGRIRVADIDAPDSGDPGYVEAKNYLSGLINGKRVYLDVDDDRTIDPYKRVICVVYIRYNNTHLKNVNKDLVEQGHAIINDFTDNEFNPYSWTLYEYYPISTLPEKTYKELLSTYLQTILDYELFNNEKETLETNVENLSTELNIYKTSTFILAPSVPILVVITFLLTRKMKH